MQHIVNTLISSFSLGLFCMGLNFYIDLHLGYEFLSTAITLEVASVLIAVAVSKNLNSLHIGAFSLATSCFLIASAYLLFAIDYVTVFSYFVALLCVILPVALISIFVINYRSTMTTVSLMTSSVVGIFVAIFVAYMLIEKDGIRGIFMLSSAALTLAITTRVNITKLIKIFAVCLFAGVLFINNYNLSDQLANWSLFGKPVAKYTLNLLHNPDKRGWIIKETNWVRGGRVDIVSTNRSHNNGNYWAIYNADVVVPFARESTSSVSWWNKHYPLVIFPFELKKPSKVLTISSAMGADAGIAQHLYSAETTSIYNDCVSLNDRSSCDRLSLNIKLETALSSEKQYDLVSFSIFNETVTPYVGVSAQHEAIHTIEVFQKLYDSLNNGGLLAINSRNQTFLRKTLSYVWQVLSKNDEDKVINFEDNIRVFALNKYNLKNDAYNYLLLVSKDGFTSDELQKMSDFVKVSPVSKIIYDTTSNKLPAKLTVSAAIMNLTKVSSREFKKLVNLEPSSIIKPDFFHLSKELHPFISVLSVFFLSLGLFGLVFSHSPVRDLHASVFQHAPALSKFLFQAFLCAVSFVLVLYAIVHFTSASLGYSSQYTSLLIFSTLTVFAVPYISRSAGRDILSSLSDLWFYPVILFLCVLFLIAMNQDFITLLSTGVQAIVFVLAVLFSFCAGLLHLQTAMFIERLYPGVWFWFWCMTSVGTVLGLILAKFIFINYDLGIIVLTAMAMWIFMTIIAWWGLAAVQGNQDINTQG